MDSQVAKNAIGTLDEILSKAKRALAQVEREVFKIWTTEADGGSYEYPREAMEEYIKEIYGLLLVVLEAADMPETRAALIKAWEGFTSLDDGLGHTEDNHKLEFSRSPALIFLEDLIKGLRISVIEEISSEEGWTLSRLEAMLDDTAALVRRRGRPGKEHDVQEVMHDYLGVFFPDFRLNPSIGGTLKNFKPDCGIASVNAAIEFKIVHTEEDVAKAFSGIAEDSAGYKGSKDWTRFYAVIYQAQPFALKSQFRSDMKRIGATQWKTILVNGPTKKRARRKKTLKKKTTKKRTGKKSVV
jgi:hypothetical protein